MDVRINKCIYLSIFINLYLLIIKNIISKYTYIYFLIINEYIRLLILT